MKAIEINSRTDNFGHLKFDFPINKKDKEVRVIILVNDDEPDSDDEKLWLQSISNNSAFEFLKDKDEDIYSLNDGEPLND